MKKFTISFNGRKIGAIGIWYPITDSVMAENYDTAILLLYDKYEHLSNVKLISIE